jgi:hypothetical protein
VSWDWIEIDGYLLERRKMDRIGIGEACPAPEFCQCPGHQGILLFRCGVLSLREMHPLDA